MRYNEPAMMMTANVPHFFSYNFFTHCRHTKIYTCHTCNTKLCDKTEQYTILAAKTEAVSMYTHTSEGARASQPIRTTHTQRTHMRLVWLQLILMHTFSFGYTSNLLFYCSVYSFHFISFGLTWRVRRFIGHTFKRQREQKRTEEKMPSARHRRHYDTHIQILNVIME